MIDIVEFLVKKHLPNNISFDVYTVLLREKEDKKSTFNCIFVDLSSEEHKKFFINLFKGTKYDQKFKSGRRNTTTVETITKEWADPNIVNKDFKYSWIYVERFMLDNGGEEECLSTRGAVEIYDDYWIAPDYIGTRKMKCKKLDITINNIKDFEKYCTPDFISG